MRSVEIVATATIWCMFSCFLLFPKLGLPAVFHRTAMTLLVAELVALAVWDYGTPGETAADTAHAAAAVDIPLLSLALVVFTVAYGVIYFRGDEDPRHRFARQGRRRDRDRAG